MAEAVAIGVLKDLLQVTFKQLKTSWQAYRGNKSEAHSVFDYADRLLRAIKPYVDGENLPENLDLGELHNAAEKARETALAVQNEIDMAKTLVGRVQTFLMADTVREKLHTLQADLKKIVEDLQADAHLRDLLHKQFVGNVLPTMTNDAAKQFWMVHGGDTTWKMPFLKFVTDYDSEARIAKRKQVTPAPVPVTPVGQGGQGSRGGAIADSVVGGHPIRDCLNWLASCCGGSSAPREQDSARTHVDPREQDGARTHGGPREQDGARTQTTAHLQDSAGRMPRPVQERDAEEGTESGAAKDDASATADEEPAADPGARQMANGQTAVAPGAAPGTGDGSAAEPSGEPSAELREQPVFPYKELTNEGRKALLYALCGDEGVFPTQLVEKDEEVTVFMLNRFVEVYGFPFNPVALPEAPKFPSAFFSTADRLSIASMCMNMMDDYSKPETDDHIKHVIDSLKDTARRIRKVLENDNNGEAVKSAAGSDEVKESAASGSTEKPDKGKAVALSEEELEKIRAAAAKAEAEAEEMQTWYTLLPLPEGLTDKKTAEKYEERQLRCFAADWLTRKLEKPEFDKLNQSRRKWSNFVLRYMTMWRLGNLTHDLFEDIDFLGTGRSVTFMEYCEPLDEANLRIKIHNHLNATSRSLTQKKTEKEEELCNEWEESRPKVYSFLRTLLKWKDEADQKNRAAKAPLPVQFGGIVPPPADPPVTQPVPPDAAGAVGPSQGSAAGGVRGGTGAAAHVDDGQGAGALGGEDEIVPDNPA